MGRSMAALYPIVLFLHGLTRWFVLLTALWLLAMSVAPVSRQSPDAWPPVRMPYHVYLSTLRLQFLLGVLLLFVSPIAQAAWSDMGGAMRDRMLRFFSIEHTVMMVLASGLAEAGMARVIKAKDDRGAARAALTYGLLSLLVILAAIPWPFREAAARPWLRGW